MALSAEQLNNVVTAGIRIDPRLQGVTTQMPSHAPLLGDDAPPMAYELKGIKAQYFINRAGLRWARGVEPETDWVELSA